MNRDNHIIMASAIEATKIAIPTSLISIMIIVHDETWQVEIVSDVNDDTVRSVIKTLCEQYDNGTFGICSPPDNLN